MNKATCKDCACLEEDKLGNWVCGEKSRFIETMTECPEGLKDEKTKAVRCIIEETVSQEFTVVVPENATEDEIFEQIRTEYTEGDLVLEPGDLESAQVDVADSNGEYHGNWREIV